MICTISTTHYCRKHYHHNTTYLGMVRHDVIVGAIPTRWSNVHIGCTYNAHIWAERSVMDSDRYPFLSNAVDGDTHASFNTMLEELDKLDVAALMSKASIRVELTDDIAYVYVGKAVVYSKPTHEEVQPMVDYLLYLYCEKHSRRDMVRLTLNYSDVLSNGGSSGL